MLNQSLLPLYVLVHELLLWKRYVVGKDLRVALIEFKDFRQSHCGFNDSVVPFQELSEVVVDEIVLEHRHDLNLLIVHDVRDNFHVKELYRGGILKLKIRRNELLDSIFLVAEGTHLCGVFPKYESNVIDFRAEGMSSSDVEVEGPSLGFVLGVAPSSRDFLKLLKGSFYFPLHGVVVKDRV